MARKPDRKTAPSNPQKKRTPRKKPRRALLTATAAYEDGRHPVDVYLSGLGEDSARVMGSALDSIADMLSDGKRSAAELAWHRLRPEHVNALRGRLQKLYAPATANRYLTALRAVMKACWQLDLVEQEAVARALDVAPIKGERRPRGRAVLTDELRAVFMSCAEDKNRAAGARDAAILAVLYGVGLRRAETAGLELGDFDEELGTLRIHGKGDKERLVFLPKGTLRALTGWLELRGYDEGPLFCHVPKNGAVRLKYVSPQLIYRVVLKRHAETGVEMFTPHDLRRSYISDLLDEGVDLATVSPGARQQKLLAHEVQALLVAGDHGGVRAYRSGKCDNVGEAPERNARCGSKTMVSFDL